MKNAFVYSSMTSAAAIAPDGSLFDELFGLYKHEIFKSLLYTFEMDFLMNDQRGGAVDTFHNIRGMDTDPNLHWKSEKAKCEWGSKFSEAQNQAHREAAEYDRVLYHNHPVYKGIVREAREQFDKNGTMIDDTYVSGKKLYARSIGDRQNQAQLDHVIAPKNVIDDPYRVLAGISPLDLANNPENLRFTNACLNNNMRDKSPEEYFKWCEEHPGQVNYNGNRGEPLPDEVKDKMRQEVKRSQKFINEKVDAVLTREYCLSPRFRKDLAKAAATEGAKIGVKQVIGFIFAEIVFAVIDEMEGVKFDLNLDLGDFFTKLGNGIKRGFENAKIKYKDIIAKFFSGTATGALSSVTTTICNIFFTTAKNVIKIIRRSWSTIVKATEIVFINPDGYLLGDRIKALVTVIATGASMIAGALVSEALESTPIGVLPFHDLIEAFCGALVSGLLSCTFIFIVDKSENVKKLVSVLNEIPTMDYEVQYYRRQAEFFENYAAKLMDYDLEKFKVETSSYEFISDVISDATTPESLNKALLVIYDKLGMDIPWKDYDSFDAFMLDPNSEDVIG